MRVPLLPLLAAVLAFGLLPNEAPADRAAAVRKHGANGAGGPCRAFKTGRGGDTAGPPHRLSTVSPGMTELRLTAAAVQLPDRDARRALSQ